MDRQPDIVVASLNEPGFVLVVEVKSAVRQVEPVERQLKQLMVHVRAPNGMLVTPDTITIFRETFRDYTEDSVQIVGKIRTDAIPELQTFASGKRKDPLDFEHAVQSWLEGLQYRARQGYLRGSDAVSLLAEHVLPALAQGEIRAAGPRARQAVAK